MCQWRPYWRKQKILFYRPDESPVAVAAKRILYLTSSSTEIPPHSALTFHGHKFRRYRSYRKQTLFLQLFVRLGLPRKNVGPLLAQPQFLQKLRNVQDLG